MASVLDMGTSAPERKNFFYKPENNIDQKRRVERGAKADHWSVCSTFGPIKGRLDFRIESQLKPGFNN